MNLYNTYDTRLKNLYHLEAYVPNEIDRLIPPSNKKRWSNKKDQKYIGSDWCDKVEKHSDMLQLALENQQQKRSLRVLFKINIFLISQYISSGQHFKIMKQSLEKVADFTLYLKQYINHNKIARLLGLKRTTLQGYIHQVKYECLESVSQFCFRANPLQLSYVEIGRLKSLMLNPNFNHWPAISIYYYGIRTGAFQFSESTFYKYTRLLGLTRRWIKKKRRKEGLKASFLNEYWHADVTKWDNNGKRYHIYLVIDNFSRMILSWKVSEKLSAELMFENLMNAYKNVISPLSQPIKLVVDGGSENQIQQAIEMNQLSISKLRSLIDIRFSNSMVEATNQTIKKYYLRPILRKTGKADPNELLPSIINEINTIRPNGSLNGLIPVEVFNLEFETPSYNQKLARITRRIENLSFSCGKCPI
ncbi:transposase family protein [bacterium SCSIO 12643]|nr:transposase family protein [bacterium SCSIO 12643]